MTTFLAFLRAINLGKNRRLPMAQLQQVLTDAGFTGVETYLATGNVRLETAKRSRSAVEAEIERVLETATGFVVPTIALSPGELTATYDAALALDVSAQRRYVTFLKDAPPAEAVAEIDAWAAPGEGARVLKRAVYWWIDHPNQQARISNARVERLAAVQGTTRDLKVVATLAERWGG
jgi:uncharacterized protein (DUF1697 family)